jgi:hypothetical protein
MSVMTSSNAQISPRKTVENKGIIEHVRPDFTKKRFYTWADIEPHSFAHDLWVVLFGKVLDLTELVQSHVASPLCQPLIDFAGKDVSHWFAAKSREPKTRVCPDSARRVHYCPNGRYLHVPADLPGTDPEPLADLPWWRSEKHVIGQLTQKARKVRIVNMLTHHIDIVEVPSEETVEEIQDRYCRVNDHAPSYTWKTFSIKPLDMESSLEENEIVDDTDRYESLNIPENKWYIPPILIYFNDDLTER